MNWQKLGCLFAPEALYPWMQSHAANPVAEHLSGDEYRVYFTCRDAENRSHIGSCVLDMGSFRISEVSGEIVLAPGEPGLFDDSGTAMGYLLNFQGRKLLYYLGWNLKVTVPWLNTIGLAEWDGQKFVKHGRVPVMDRSEEDPYSISYPSILEEEGSLRMWYGSNLTWGSGQESMRHVIKTATSLDGIQWQRSNRVALNLEHPGEYAISKPLVLRGDSGYEMWYSYRGNGSIDTYRIGYATSVSGDVWFRHDMEVGIDVSIEGWDSEMVCYPYVFDHKGSRYMLYNGNGYGRTGFGLASLA